MARARATSTIELLPLSISRNPDGESPRHEKTCPPRARHDQTRHPATHGSWPLAGRQATFGHGASKPPPGAKLGAKQNPPAKLVARFIAHGRCSCPPRHTTNSLSNSAVREPHGIRATAFGGPSATGRPPGVCQGKGSGRRMAGGFWRYPEVSTRSTPEAHKGGESRRWARPTGIRSTSSPKPSCVNPPNSAPGKISGPRHFSEGIRALGPSGDRRH